MKINASSWAIKLFCLFLLTDIYFIIQHCVYSYNDLSSIFSIEQDQGYAEFFQYMKEYWSILLLGSIVVKKRSPLYLSWLLLFLYLLIDDAISIHEDLGLFISNSLGIADRFRLRGQDFGELIVTSSVSLFLFSYIGIAYRLGDRLFRKASQYLIMMLLALAAFGVVIDLIHVMAHGRLHQAFGLVEDGGEMLVMSAMASFVFILSERVQLKPNASKSAQPIRSKVLSQDK